MAGGVSRTLGVLALILGIVGLVAGGGAALYGFLDQQEHQQESLLENPDRTAQNEMLMLYGGTAAASGLLLTMVAVILLVAAGARSRSELLEAVRGGDGNARERRTRSGILVGGIAAIAVLMVVLAVVLAGAGGFGGASTDGSKTALGSQSINGTIEPSASLPMVGTVTTVAPRHPLEVPAGAASLVAVLNWTAAPGAETLSIRLEQQVDGGWSTIAAADGAPGFALEAAIDASATWRLSVWANDTGPSAGTDYSILVSYA